MYTLFLAALMLVGLGLMAVGAVKFRRTKTFVDRAHRAAGRYVSFETRGGGENSADHMVVEFETADGRSFQFVARSSSYFARWRVGEDVEVLYDPAYPSDALVNQWPQLWESAVFFAVFGIVLTVLVIVGM